MSTLFIDGAGSGCWRRCPGDSLPRRWHAWSRPCPRPDPRTRSTRSRPRDGRSTPARGPATASLERGALLHRVADLLERDKEEVARLESLDTGKRIIESRYDVDDIVGVFRHFAGLAGAESGRVVDTGRPGVVSRVVHEPVGVCSLITPWNYPLLQTAWKVAPAIAAGNTFVLKPSELTPSTAIWLMRAARRGGSARRSRQPRARRRRRCRSHPHDSSRGRPGLVHRRARHRPRRHGCRRPHGQEGRPRARRQEPQHRVRRRRSRDGTGLRADRGVPALGPGLLGRRPPPCRVVDPRRVRRRARTPG